MISSCNVQNAVNTKLILKPPTDVSIRMLQVPHALKSTYILIFEQLEE